jgi:hypothetical protein
MKLLHPFVLFIFFTPLIKTIAQDISSVEKNLFKINLLLPGVVYEHGFTTKNTLYSELSFGIGYKNSTYSGDNWSFYPNINEQFRHYYNLEKRVTRGKRTLGNSGNFYGLNVIYNFESIDSNTNFSPSNPSFTIAPVWGFQRTYKHNLNLNLNIGVGYDISENENKTVLVFNFTLGWIIGK